MKKTTFYKVLTPEGNWGKTITRKTRKQVDKILRRFPNKSMYVKKYTQTKSDVNPRLCWVEDCFWGV